MKRLVAKVADDKLFARVGIGGNLYIVSKNKSKLVELCHSIGKAPSSIYLNKKSELFTVRIKSSHHKEKVKLVVDIA